MNYEKDIHIDETALLRRKRMNKRPGVYIIINKITSQYYIGSSAIAKNRIKIHLNELRKGIHNNLHLQRSWNKYGENNFKFDIIMYCQKEELLTREQEFIDKFQAFNPKFGYNKCPKANNTLGYIWTNEQKEKSSISHKGQIAWNKGKMNIYSEETLKLISLSRLGKPAWNKGIKRTEEEKKKMSENRKGKPAWNKGISTSYLVGEKIAEANRNRIWKEETRLKMSESRKGKKLSLEHSNAISNGLKGHIVSEETKQKIRESLKSKLK